MNDTVTIGTCSLCGQEMFLTDTDCWHPWDIKVACPPQRGHGLVEWGRTGRPGRQYFVPYSSADNFNWNLDV